MFTDSVGQTRSGPTTGVPNRGGRLRVSSLDSQTFRIERRGAGLMVLQSLQAIGHVALVGHHRPEIVAVLPSQLGQQAPSLPHHVQTGRIFLETLGDPPEVRRHVSQLRGQAG